MTRDRETLLQRVESLNVYLAVKDIKLPNNKVIAYNRNVVDKAETLTFVISSITECARKDNDNKLKESLDELDSALHALVEIIMAPLIERKSKLIDKINTEGLTDAEENELLSIKNRIIDLSYTKQLMDEIWECTGLTSNNTIHLQHKIRTYL